MVGQAGKPKTITGFQTHTTPVLLGYGERAELATEECILIKTNLLALLCEHVSPWTRDCIVLYCPIDCALCTQNSIVFSRGSLTSPPDVSLSPIVEGFVILKKNPDYEE